MKRRGMKNLRRCLAGLLVLAMLPAAVVAAGRCDNARPKEIFEALEAIDDAGEAELKQHLEALAKQEGWSTSRLGILYARPG